MPFQYARDEQAIERQKKQKAEAKRKQRLERKAAAKTPSDLTFEANELDQDADDLGEPVDGTDPSPQNNTTEQD